MKPVEKEVCAFVTSELIPPCDVKRREKVGAVYSAVYGSLASSAQHTLDFSLLCHRIYVHVRTKLIHVKGNKKWKGKNVNLGRN